MTRLCYPEWRPMLLAWKREFGEVRVMRPGCQAPIGPEGITMLLDGSCLDTTGGRWGMVPCAPETLREHAENVLRQRGLLDRYFEGQLTLDAYSLARNIASEQDSGTVEEKVAMGLSTMGRAKLRGTSVSSVILGNNRGVQRYGRIHGYFDRARGPFLIGPHARIENHSKCERSTQFGRFTASTLDPTILDLLIAQFVLTGGAGAAGDLDNFARGADNQAHLENSTGWVLNKAAERSYWVGDVPGVNPHRITLFRVEKGISPDSPEGRRRVQAGVERIAGSAGAPLVTCGPGAGTVALKIVGALGGVALTGYLLSRLLKGTSATRLSRLLPEL